MIVVDASAVLAVLNEERGAEFAIAQMRGGLFGTVNLTETIAKAGDHGVPAASLLELIERLDVTVVPFDREQALAAALLRPRTRQHNVSLADRACLGLAMHRNLPVLTADTKWAELDLGLDIRLIR